MKTISPFQPGFLNIYDHFLMGAMDHSNALSGPEDVSMAIGCNLALSPREFGLIEFLLTQSVFFKLWEALCAGRITPP